MILKVPYYKQDTGYSCGPASLEMLLAFHGVRVGEKRLMRECGTTREDGTDHQSLIDEVLKEDLFCYVNSGGSIEEIESFVLRGLPVLVHYIEPASEEGHYSVCVGVDEGSVILNDPWNGEGFSLLRDEFELRWRDGENRFRRWLLVASKEDLALGKQYRPKRAEAAE